MPGRVNWLTCIRVTFESNSVDETEAVAATIASRLRGRECIALDGDLGAGKTQFVRGLVVALGGDGRAVSSPTFVLLHVYDTPRLKVFHLDAYRLHGVEELEGIGFAELLDQPAAVTVVEWAQRVHGAMPEKSVQIRITATGETSRRIDIVE